MDRSESHMNVKLGKTDSRSPSQAEPDVSYAELHFKTLSTPQVRTDRDGLNSTYSQLNFRKEEPCIAENEDPHIYLGHRGLSTTAETVAKEQDAKVKIRNKTHRLICLLCLVTSAFFLIVTGLSIHVLQIRQCNVTFERNYNELNSTFQSKLSALNSYLSDLERMHRTVNETKAQLCEFLTSRREDTCSGEWVTKRDRCYYASTVDTSFHEAKQQCADRGSRLLQIRSSDEAIFVSDRLLYEEHSYWIEKCETGSVGRSFLYMDSPGKLACTQCTNKLCDVNQHFICEKSAQMFPDIPEKIQGLCQQPEEATRIN